MNVHKRCQKNVANNCGINTKQMAEILNQIGISPDKNTPRRSKYINQSCSSTTTGDELSSMGGSDSSGVTGSTGGSSLMGSSLAGDNGDESAEDNGKYFFDVIITSDFLLQGSCEDFDNGNYLFISWFSLSIFHLILVILKEGI